MPLLFQNLIERRDLTQHPDRLYLFGDNEARTGRGGQAGACRGFANAVGVATKRVPERTASAYWTDADYDRVIAIIDRDLAPVFDHVRQGGTVVCPASGLGTGLAELPSRAPRVFAYLRERIILLKQLGQATPGPSLPRILNKKTDHIPATAYYCGRQDHSEILSSSVAMEPATKSATSSTYGCRHSPNSWRWSQPSKAAISSAGVNRSVAIAEQ